MRRLIEAGLTTKGKCVLFRRAMKRMRGGNKMPRPKGDNVQLNARLYPEDIALIKETGRRLGITYGAVVASAVERFLDATNDLKGGIEIEATKGRYKNRNYRVSPLLVERLRTACKGSNITQHAAIRAALARLRS